MSAIDLSNLPGQVKWLVGNESISRHPMQQYDAEACAFLAKLSKQLLSSPAIREYPDVASFAYWCRKQNIEKKKQNSLGGTTDADNNRLGRGLAFHVTPSNIPVNFAFSFVFALLAGNANIVRVPSKPFAQIEIICNAINQVIAEFPEVEKRTAFISYASNDQTTAELCKIADSRLLWGGDATIGHIQALSHKASCKDVLFADRYSIAVIDAASIESASDNNLEQLAQSFYNDTYLMDQNACSSPQAILWLHSSVEGKKRFWDSVRKFAETRYDLQPTVVIDKYARLCGQALQGRIQEATFDGLLTVAEIDALSLGAKVVELRGIGGLFFESKIASLDDLAPMISDRIQTVVYWGLDPKLIQDMVIRNRLRGIDRIVPIGSAMDIDIVWDGYDLADELSRIIDLR